MEIGNGENKMKVGWKIRKPTLFMNQIRNKNLRMMRMV